jgi:arylformamidase
MRMLLSKAKKTYDLSVKLSNETVIFPEDPPFQADAICSIGPKSQYRLCRLSLGNHTGTHIDFPSHVIEGGKTSNDFSLGELIGSGLVVEVPDSEISISKDFVAKQADIAKGSFVFFKTSNSKVLSKLAPFTEAYVYLEPKAAEELIKKGVKIVGIDYISVDKYESKDLPVHKLLLSKDILIVEGLELQDIPTGKYEIIIAPIKISATDGAPARVCAIPCY